MIIYNLKLLIFLCIIILLYMFVSFSLHMSFCSCESCWWEGTNHELGGGRGGRGGGEEEEEGPCLLHYGGS